MTAIWDYLVANWHSILLGGVGASIIAWGASWLDGKGAAFVHDEFEKLRVLINTNPLMSQITADDAIISILEATIPMVLSDFDATVHQTLAQGNLGAMDWMAFGKKLWTESKTQIEGGVNNYLKNSSFQDGEAVAAYIAQRFFTTQAMAAKGLIVDSPRVAVTDLKTTTTQTVQATRAVPPTQVVSQDVHTEVKPGV